MSRVEDLPPDLRAVLALLVGRHKHYGEIASMLSIEERAVHDRAHAALALLAPRQARELSPAQREQVGEYLLRQAPLPGQSATVTYLESSAAARAWAQALTAELGPLSSEALPTIPTAGPAPEGAIPEGAIPNGAAPDGRVAPPAVTRMSAPPGVSPAVDAPRAPSSRRGGALLLGGLAVVVIVAVALIVGLGSGGGSPNSASTSTAPGGSSGGTSTATSSNPSTTSSTPAKSGKSGKSASEPHLTATLPLTPFDTASKALGLVEVIAEGSEHAFILAAERLPPTNGFHYAAWLYNTPTDAYFLGGGTTVNSKGTLKAAQALPANAAHYATIILTEEHEEHPKQPGPIVLSGSFKLG
jgi:hypothetical protein